MTIEIEQSSWDRVPLGSYPDDITTEGMGPCVGIFIYAPHSKVTYGGHFPSPHEHEEDDLNEMLDKAITEFNTNPVNVYVSGCTHDNPNSAHIRKFIQKKLTSTCSNNFNINIMWPGDSFNTVEMVLEPNSGTCEIFERNT